MNATRPTNSPIASALCAVLIALLATGCVRSSETRKARHLDRGDTYFTQQRYRDAVTEYAIVLHIDRNDVRALRQAALAHYRLGEVDQAMSYVLRFHGITLDESGRRDLASILSWNLHSPGPRHEGAAPTERTSGKAGAAAAQTLPDPRTLALVGFGFVGLSTVLRKHVFGMRKSDTKPLPEHPVAHVSARDTGDRRGYTTAAGSI